MPIAVAPVLQQLQNSATAVHLGACAAMAALCRVSTPLLPMPARHQCAWSTGVATLHLRSKAQRKQSLYLVVSMQGACGDSPLPPSTEMHA